MGLIIIYFSVLPKSWRIIIFFKFCLLPSLLVACVVPSLFYLFQFTIANLVYFLTFGT